jgi:hypothetical protein
MLPSSPSAATHFIISYNKHHDQQYVMLSHDNRNNGDPS